MILFSFCTAEQIIWEQLYEPTATGGRDQGTLYHLRQHFKLVNVPQSVKKNYSACEALLLSATKAYLCNAFMTWLQISSTDAYPSWLHLGKFVDQFVMTEFDIEKSWLEQLEQQRQQRPQGGNTSTTEQAESAVQNVNTPGEYITMLN